MRAMVLFFMRDGIIFMRDGIGFYARDGIVFYARRYYFYARWYWLFGKEGAWGVRDVKCAMCIMRDGINTRWYFLCAINTRDKIWLFWVRGWGERTRFNLNVRRLLGGRGRRRWLRWLIAG